MNNNRFAAYYAIFVGAMMALQWLFFLVTGNVPELESAPLAIAFHLAAEALTAVALIIAGVGLLRRLQWALPAGLLAMGMLLYTAVNSAGYFAEQAVWGMVGMFGVVLLLAFYAAWSLASGWRDAETAMQTTRGF